MSMSQSVPLSIDWLAISLRLKSRVGAAPAGHHWAFYTQTNVWFSRWCLYNDYGEKVFTLLFQPRSGGFLHADAALFEVANEWLYHGLGFRGALELLRQSCDFEINGMSRVDLAADFTPDEHQRSVITRLASGDCYVSGKRSGSGFWSVVHDEKLSPYWQGKIPHCQSWGHKTSDVKWKLYYKTKELRDEGKGQWSKPYIVDMWRDVGLDENNVWRLEVSIHNANGFDFMGEKLTFDRFCHSGSDLYQALYTSRFQIRENQGHKDKSNDRLVDFLPVGRLSTAFKVRRRDVIAEHNGSLTLLRHLVADLQSESVMMNEPVRESLITAVQTIVDRDGLHRYLREVVGMEVDDWVEWLRVQAYYFGEQNVMPAIEDDTILEMSMLEAGLIHDNNVPLGTSSSLVSPSGAQQSMIFTSYDK